MRLIRQRLEDDCGVAVLAMVCGVSYGEAWQALTPDRDPDDWGTPLESLRDAAQRFGVELVARPVAPLLALPTSVLIVSLLRQCPHFVVWCAESMRLLDPWRDHPESAWDVEARWRGVTEWERRNPYRVDTVLERVRFRETYTVPGAERGW